MAIPSILQESSVVSSTATSVTVTLTSVTAGSTIVAQTIQVVSATRTYSVSDDNGGSYTQLEKIVGGGGQTNQVEVAENVASGASVVVTNTVNTSGQIRYFYVIEVSESSAVAHDQLTSVTTNDHYCAASGNIDTTETDILALAGWMASTSTGGSTTGSWAIQKNFSPASGLGRMYKLESSSALTDERCAWTGTNNRTTYNWILALAPPAAAGGQPAIKRAGGVPFMHTRRGVIQPSRHW